MGTEPDHRIVIRTHDPNTGSMEPYQMHEWRCEIHKIGNVLPKRSKILEQIRRHMQGRCPTCGELVWRDRNFCVDCLVAHWHDDDNTDVPLHEFLGVTWEEYQSWGQGDQP